MLKNIYRKEAIEYKNSLERESIIVSRHPGVVGHLVSITFSSCSCIVSHILYLHSAH